MTGIASFGLIVLYSIGYMDGDDEERRYFAYMSLFVFSMLLLVQAGNFLLLLAGWGLVGLASYLLIGFWHQRPEAVAAAKKAFIMNAFGDATMALAFFVPVSMLQGLVSERQARRNEAVDGIAQGWGKRQTLAGPWLAVPYERTRGDKTENLTLRLPAEGVQWSLAAQLSEKSRGIYKARLYAASDPFSSISSSASSRSRSTDSRVKSWSRRLRTRQLSVDRRSRTAVATRTVCSML